MAEIQDLLAKKAAIDDRLKILTGVKQEEKRPVTPKPEGFSLMDAIRSVISDMGIPMAPAAINAAIVEKFAYDPTVKITRATAKYMVKRGQLKLLADKQFYLM